MAYQRPKYALYLGVICIALSKTNSILLAIMLGSFMSLVSTPMETAKMLMEYPNTGETEGTKILEHMI